jgi:transposase
MKKSYPSDISREQFEAIQPFLESARKRTRPRTVDLYDVFCGILYILKSGCQWRMPPQDFPKWRTTYSYFQQWTESSETNPSILEQALKKTGWQGSYETGQERSHHILHIGCSKC